MVSRLENIDKSIDKNMEDLSNLFQEAIYNNGEFKTIEAYRLFYDIVEKYREYRDIIEEYDNVLRTAEKIKYFNKGDQCIQFKGLTDELLTKLYSENNGNVNKIVSILKNSYKLDYSWSGVNKRLKQLYLK